MLSASILRRSFLSAVLGGAAAAFGPAAAQAQPAASPAAPIQRLNDALLAIMQAGRSTPFGLRSAMAAPAIDAAFDLPAVMQASVGLRWASLAGDEQARLIAAFRRYTIANYVANFDDFSGESFRISPDWRVMPNGDRVVRTSIDQRGEAGHALEYVMREAQAGWKAVDVLADGAISRVAVQRSDFRTILARGGGVALIADLERKTADLASARQV